MSRPIAFAVTRTNNKKLGLASTTLASQVSCPSSCVFREAGCYAERGMLGFIHGRRLNGAAEELGSTPLDVAQAEADAIDAMDTVVDRPLRLHTVGDCPTDEAAQVVSAAAERYMDRGGGPAWTYTHAWREVARESWGRVSVLASCETEEHVEQARARGYAAAIVVDEFPHDRKYRHGSIDIVPCPSMTKEDVTCASCRLCFNDRGLLERETVIGFEVHGDPTTKKRARAALGKEQALDDVGHY